MQWVAAHLTSPEVRMVEAGCSLCNYNSGNIPGAVNIPWQINLKEDGTFESFEDLQSLNTNSGVNSDKEVIPSFIVGERSNQTWFILTCLLGAWLSQAAFGFLQPIFAAAALCLT